MNYEYILFDCADGVARVTLNRPKILNSYTKGMNAELADALTRIAADKTARVLVITGSGRGFCAGASLAEMWSPDLGVVLDEANPVVEQIRALPVPVIGAVNGVAVGAGVSIALACDIVIAAKSANFMAAFTKVGLLPDMGGTYFLPRLIGTARAMGVTLLAQGLSGEQAADWGLVWKCVDDADLAQTADGLARQLANAPRRALELTKRAMHASEGNSLSQQLALERDCQSELGFSEDFKEAAAAFLEKRPPQFKK